MHLTRFGAGIFTIHDFLSAQECAGLIAQSEQIGFTEAVISTDEGDRILKDARNNDRILHDDADLAKRLFTRALPCLPPDLDRWYPSGFNPRFRFYRYTNEQFFKWHQDGTYRPSEQEESMLTFIIYLNADYEGGATEFGWESIRPQTGMALVFPHRLRHQGARVLAGTKYVLRTDVMYRNAADQTGTPCMKFI
ncbi:2OG-Fe(II) oxygenase superfamily protein [Massilia sp. CF038]|nr:2OG-Fe(II) oxygenase superfamily protein [Massilia sp. CF038]